MTPEEIVQFSEALARIAASGGGPKALAAHLAKAARGGVLLEDSEWRHLAAAGTGSIPSSARAVVETGAEGRAQRITAGNVELGWLSLFGSDRTADAGILLRIAAAAIGVEMARDGAALRERKANFWDSLVAREFHDAASARQAARARGITLAPAYLAIALEAEGSADKAGDTNAARALVVDVFRCCESDVGLLERGATLIVFVPATRELDVSNAKTAAMLLPKSAAKRKPHLQISGGVGTVANLLALDASERLAQAALSIGRRLFGGGRVMVYDDLGAYRLLYEGADVDCLQKFAAETLAPLRGYDEKHQTELERTLKLYFHVGQNVKTAAAQLNVHRHTVFYRLRQIGEICARSLDSPHDQLTLRLAVAIDELHNAD